MSVPRITFVLMIFLILMSKFGVTAASGELNEEGAASALVNAEGVVVSAYQTVLEAQQAGANISGLLGQLNKAEEDLALAHMAYRQGDFQKASGFANSSKNIGEEVLKEAVDVRDAAFAANVKHMWLIMIGSVVGIAAIYLGSFWVWRIFKRRYYTRVLGMKPGASPNES